MAASLDAAAGPPPDAATTGDGSGVETSGCVGLAAAESDSEWSIESTGRTRQFDVHVPVGYDPDVRTPVVLNFHGFTHDSDRQQSLSGMNEFADEAGFIAVHPQGVGDSWNAGGCCGQAESSDVDDVQFVSDLLDALETELCVDGDRVYATGMSNGGHLSYRLGCDLADRLAGVAPVAGTDTTNSCNPSRPVPLIHFHGTEDFVVPWSGSILEALRPVEDSVGDWAERNGCGDTRTVVFANGDSRCEAYDGCPSGAEVTLCIVTGGGHTWPGGEPLIGLGKTTGDLSATRKMWEFWTSATND